MNLAKEFRSMEADIKEKYDDMHLLLKKSHQMYLDNAAHPEMPKGQIDDIRMLIIHILCVFSRLFSIRKFVAVRKQGAYRFVPTASDADQGRVVGSFRTVGPEGAVESYL